MSQFAVPFYRQFKYFDDDVQLNIIYKPKIKQLAEFIKDYRTHRINFIIPEFNKDRDSEIFETLNDLFSDAELVLCFPYYDDWFQNWSNEHQIKHYYQHFVNSWENLERFLSYNVTDIKVGENLAFNAEKISKIAKEKGVSLRVFCNVCQRKIESTIPSIKGFFIRPEDIDLYSEYFDTFELAYPNMDATRLNTLYEIYAKDKIWDGRVKQIIVGYEGNEDNTFLIGFGKRRSHCDRKCYQATGVEKCCFCDRLIDLNKTIKERIQ